MADIDVVHENKEYSFTLRSNARDITLNLTAYKDDKVCWSSYSEQCKPVEKRVTIEIPAAVAEEAKLLLNERIVVQLGI